METYDDAFLKSVLQRTKTVAVVGVSMNSVRPSYYVARYLGLKGFKVIPVNPGHAGKMLFGQTVRASLSEIDETHRPGAGKEVEEARRTSVTQSIDLVRDTHAFALGGGRRY